jgi:hypothetical protein
MKGIAIVALLTLSMVSTYAQRKSSKKEKEEVEDYKIFAYGATTNTNSGLLGGFVVRHSKTISNYKGFPINRYIALEAVNVRHNKENPEVYGIGRFIYGKTNYLISLRPEYGREVIFFNKKEEDGIGISAIFAAGPTIGLQKPYFVKYSKNQYEVVIVQYDPSIELNRIQGATGLWQGFFKNLTVIPGAHVKLAANIDMNTFGNSLTGFEIGITAEYFAKKPELMAAALTSNYNFFTAGYLTLYFGNKKQK